MTKTLGVITAILLSTGCTSLSVSELTLGADEKVTEKALPGVPVHRMEVKTLEGQFVSRKDGKPCEKIRTTQTLMLPTDKVYYVNARSFFRSNKLTVEFSNGVMTSVGSEAGAASENVGSLLTTIAPLLGIAAVKEPEVAMLDASPLTCDTGFVAG